MEWSQDGTKLLMSGPVAQEKEGIWMVSVIGATLKKLRDDAFDAALSPDGSQILFRDSSNRHIWLMESDGQQARELIKPEEGFHFFRPTWFPGGKRLLYLKYRVANGQVVNMLESRDLKGGDPQVLVADPRLIDFCWASKGRVIYSSGELPPNQYDSNLWEVRTDPDNGKLKGTPRRLTDWTGFTFVSPEMTADGKRMVFLNDRAQGDVYLAELANNGTEAKTPQRLTLSEAIDWPGGWTPDSKTVLLYSDRNGSFDIFKQEVGSHDAVPIVTGPEEKRAPEISPDGKWVVYMAWPKWKPGDTNTAGKMMRAPVAGGPPEAIMDIKGHPGPVASAYPGDTMGGYPSFRCPMRAGLSCVLAEDDETRDQITFTAFDPVEGRKAEIAKLPLKPFLTHWDLSPTGDRLALSIFDYKAAEVQVIQLAGGAPQKMSALPWTELSSVKWAPDGKSLFLTSFSSRGTSILHMGLDGHPKLLLKTTWDMFSAIPSPDGRYLALSPMIDSANAWTIASFPEK